MIGLAPDCFQHLQGSGLSVQSKCYDSQVVVGGLVGLNVLGYLFIDHDFYRSPLGISFMPVTQGDCAHVRVWWMCSTGVAASNVMF